MNGPSILVGEDPVADLAVVEAMVAELEEYIVKDELYRTLIVDAPAGSQRVSMTGGDMLTRFYRLQHEDDLLTPAQRLRVDDLETQAETVIRSLKTRFNARLLREMKARLDSLSWFLDDCGADLRRCRTNFPFEMRNRQRIQEILKRVGDDVPEALQARLAQVDSRIRQYAAAGPFIWEKRLEPIFPAHTYWYLYVRP